MVYHAVFDNFGDLQAFCKRQLDIIEIINLQRTIDGYEIFYYQVSERISKTP